MVRKLPLLITVTVLTAIAVLVVPVQAQENTHTAGSFSQPPTQPGDEASYQYESGVGVGAPTTDAVSVSGSFRQGYSTARQASKSIGTAPQTHHINEWRGDVMEKYNPAVEEGKVPGFVTSIIERRMLAEISRDSGDPLYISIKTNPDGEVTSFEAVSEEEVPGLNQQAKIETSLQTVKDIRGSDDPASEAKDALKTGAVEVHGEGFVNSIKHELVERSARSLVKIQDAVSGSGEESGSDSSDRSSSGSSSEPNSRKEGESHTEVNGLRMTLQETGLGYTVGEPVRMETKGPCPTSGSRTVVGENGILGMTTAGTQALLQTGGTDGLSPDAGIYLSPGGGKSGSNKDKKPHDSWEKTPEQYKKRLANALIHKLKNTKGYDKLSAKEKRRAKKEARVLADEIVKHIKKKYNKGWRDGSHRFEEGLCGQWLGVMRNAMKAANKRLGNRGLRFWGKLEFTSKEWGTDHTVVGFHPNLPGARSVEDTVLVDPWRKNGEPWWIDGKRDDYDWDNNGVPENQEKRNDPSK